MRLLRLKNALVIAAVLALIMPGYCLVRHALDPKYFVWHAEFLFWPTLIMLDLTELSEHTVRYYAFLAGSIAANVLVYVIVCAAFWSLAWLIRMSIRALRGTEMI